MSNARQCSKRVRPLPAAMATFALTVACAAAACAVCACWAAVTMHHSPSCRPTSVTGPSRVAPLTMASSARRLFGRPRGTAISRAAVCEPPTITAPPEVGTDAETSRGEWAECLIQYADTSADAQEVWVFRTGDFEDFQRLIGLRLSYKPKEVGGQRFGADRRAAAEASTKVLCRERSIDPQLVCAECIRVFTGGAYKDKAIAVPAYPSQPFVLGCLGLSVGNQTEAVPEDPACPLRQTAFCNTVNARFSSVSA